MQLLREASLAPDRAVIVVTHDPRIHGFADRIARMEDGRLIDIVEGAALAHPTEH
jgi:putative ABC transport system ATP-binding protein